VRLGPELDASWMRTVVECAVSAALAGKRIVEIVRAIWVLGAVILLRVVSGVRQVPIGQ
jgi:hypothetical protein